MPDSADEERLYTTPDMVAEVMGLPPDYGDDSYGFFRFSDTTVPSYDAVTRMIKSNMDIIDRRIRRSWRENFVKDKVCSISTYWPDVNGVRIEYYNRGGYYVQLRKDMLPWDPSKGDRMEIRTRNNSWRDITYIPLDDSYPETEQNHKGVTAYWFDYPMGKMYIRTRLFQSPYNAIRISYRYGSLEEPPDSIQRLCALMTASQVINMSVFAIKVGQGGDIAGVRQDLQKMWQEEMNSIWSSWQRSGSVHSMLG